MTAPLLGFGRGRDLVTQEDGSAREVSSGELWAALEPRTRQVLDVATELDHPALQGLVGLHGGLRARIAELVPEGIEAGSVLSLMFGDLAGTSLIAPFVLTRSLSTAAWE